MIDAETRSKLAKRVHVAQFIASSLIAGVVAFGAVAVIRGDKSLSATTHKLSENPVNAVAVACGGILLGVAIGIPKVIVEPGLRRIARGQYPNSLRVVNEKLTGEGELLDWVRLFGLFFTRLIICLGLTEGAAFLNLVVHMRQPEIINLIVAGVMVLAMMSQFPTLARVERWIEKQSSRVEELRRLTPTAT